MSFPNFCFLSSIITFTAYFSTPTEKKEKNMNSQKVAYSILDLAVVAQGNSIQETLHRSLAVAKAAEASNYERVWYAEHHNTENVASTATSLLIGYVAENTERIRVGSGGVMLPNHSPLIIAEQFGTLAHLYPNRIDLGLGRAPGTDQATAHAIRPDFMQAAQSFPREIEKIEQYFSEENKSSNVRAAIAEGTNVPLYILGSSTDSAHLAAATGKPYAFASHFASTYLHQALEIYRQEFQPSEETDKPYTIAGINVFVADTDEEAEAMFTSLIRLFVSIATGSRQSIQAPAPMNREFLEYLQHPRIASMIKYSFVGSKDTVKAKMRDFLNSTGVDEVITSTNAYYVEDRIKSLQLFAALMDELNEEKIEDK